jgi:threonine synthase
MRYYSTNRVAEDVTLDRALLTGHHAARPGPTASFKDFAARMMARWMGALIQQRDGELVILTATSGDTGSAVAHAYHGRRPRRVVVLFPIDEVSDRQRRR